MKWAARGSLQRGKSLDPHPRGRYVREPEGVPIHLTTELKGAKAQFRCSRWMSFRALHKGAIQASDPMIAVRTTSKP